MESQITEAPRLMNVAEAAIFLRKSKSWVYQNPAIPRYRPPGSRQWLYDRDELLEWVKSGNRAVDTPKLTVYHRRAIYR